MSEFRLPANSRINKGVHHAAPAGAQEVRTVRIYRAEDARETLSVQGIDVNAIAPQVDGKFLSAFIRALKPGRASDACCDPTCCN